MCNHVNDPGGREAAMLPIEGTPVPGVTTKVGYCDPCIHPLVQALNDGGQHTIASCCGHGYRPGRITLADGRELFLLPDYDSASVAAGLFPVGINGEDLAAPAPEGER